MDAPSLWSPLLLLFSVFSLSISSDLRRFVLLSEEKKNWEGAQKKCEEEKSHLVTVNDDHDYKVLGAFGTMVSCHLGLHKKDRSQSEWSNGDQVTFSQSNVSPTNQSLCETIERDEWTGYKCLDTKYFMCYTSSDYQLIEKKKNWCDARRYCRKHHTDLVSISSRQQNEAVIKRGANRTFWIGLTHDQFEWDDGQCSTFKAIDGFDTSQHKCLNWSPIIPPVSWDSCDIPRSVVCVQGKFRITAPPQRLTWEEAFDYCKENHHGLLFIRGEGEQESLRQWLREHTGPGPFWIGLRQSRLFGFWMWATVDQVADYSNWKDDRPPELPLSHHCGVVAKPSYKWRAEPCHTKLNFLCVEDMNP
ncbi:hypothetical protein NHX12_020539 [Muraenolepis orangiensis]|uniref:C-type lectin domain-containing protein n=1 Tax=Muraenolepis orangiensis TaxID=630683 RepID=A0A9Q0ETP3_9TELE|nr:hypothetical protein NHX12_020539 [Muraenolepis orangiensis]